MLIPADVTVGLELTKDLGEVLITYTQLPTQVLLLLRTKLGKRIEDALRERRFA